MKKLLILGVLGTAFSLVAARFGESAEILSPKVDRFCAQETAEGSQVCRGVEVEDPLSRPSRVNGELLALLPDLFPLEPESADGYPTEAPRRQSAPMDFNVDADATTSMHVVKFRGNAETVKPFLVLGGGRLDPEAEQGRHVCPVPASGPGSPKDTGAKVGLGIDVFASDGMLVGLEGSHVWAFDGSRDPRSFTLTLGIAYHF